MKKRIGILTRHCYPNYGSILQTFALQSAFKKLEQDVVVIDYIHKDDTARGLVSANLRKSKKHNGFIKSIIYRLVQTPTFYSMVSVFRKHQLRLLSLSRTVSNYGELAEVGKELDIAVAGSDQVWNRIIDCIDERYFLKFMSSKYRRVSYAASLGSDKPLDEDKEQFLDGIKQMGVVSVREPSSAKWINEQGVDAEARDDIDPVLLHSKEFWSEFAGENKIKKPYILVYQLHATKDFDELLQKIESTYNLPVYRMSPDWKKVFSRGKTQLLISPEQFVAFIRDANCVVTDSFHGVAFSLRLGVPLYVMPPGKYSTRLTDVLARVGLEDKVVLGGSDLNKLGSPEYDAETVGKKLDEIASKSWALLEKISSGEYDESQ